MVTSAMMSAVRAKGNKAEVALRKALWRRGFRYRVYPSKLAGRLDLVFPKWRAIVFVDGDFWHGRAIVEEGQEAFAATMRTERRDWWVAKIGRNVERDHEVTATLEKDGWRVVRVWEQDVTADTDGVADRIADLIRA